MVFPHQQMAIDYITNKFFLDDQADALLISGSIAHGFNDERSDVDINIVISDEVYRQKSKENILTYWEPADNFYNEGYFDGKYISLDYLNLVAERGNEPSRFALHDSQIAFDKTGKVVDCLKKISAYSFENIQEKAIRFVSQLDAWKWYCDEAIKKENPYLLDLSVSKLILFAGRLVLLENRMLFPYHKWFMRVLESAEKKPSEFLSSIDSLLKEKSPNNITKLYETIKNYKDWSEGVPYNWASHFVFDTETVWMRQNDFIENI